MRDDIRVAKEALHAVFVAGQNHESQVRFQCQRIAVEDDALARIDHDDALAQIIQRGRDKADWLCLMTQLSQRRHTPHKMTHVRKPKMTNPSYQDIPDHAVSE